MAQNYRNQSGRSDYGRGGRYQSGSDRDRYRTGDEQRFNPEWDERNQSHGFEGDRSFDAGGYSEEFGYRGGAGSNAQGSNFQRSGQYGGDQNRDYGSNYDYQSRGSGRGQRDDQYGRGQSQRGYGQESSRFGRGEFDEGNRWSESSGRRDFDDFADRNRGTTTSRWHEDQNDRGGFFGTGSYVDDGGASRGFGADFDRARAQVQQRFGHGRGTSGDYSNYGQSDYGSQSGYGRDSGSGSEQRPWRNQQGSSYQQRSGWDYGSQGQRAGSGSSGGAYGYDRGGSGSDYSSYAGSQSHRGRGPQGYQRSDERLKELICERLTDDPAIDASNISIEVTSQVVKLTGTVDDRSTKYEIEELVERLGGVKDIDNQLRVQSGRTQSSQGQSTQGSSGQQLRGGSDWEAGSSSLSSSGSSKATSGTSGSGTSSGTSSTTGTPSSKRN